MRYGSRYDRGYYGSRRRGIFSMSAGSMKYMDVFRKLGFDAKERELLKELYEEGHGTEWKTFPEFANLAQDELGFDDATRSKLLRGIAASYRGRAEGGRGGLHIYSSSYKDVRGYPQIHHGFNETDDPEEFRSWVNEYWEDFFNALGEIAPWIQDARVNDGLYLQGLFQKEIKDVYPGFSSSRGWDAEANALWFVRNVATTLYSWGSKQLFEIFKEKVEDSISAHGGDPSCLEDRSVLNDVKECFREGDEPDSVGRWLAEEQV